MQAKGHGVQVQGFADLVDDRFQGEIGRGGARGAIGGHMRGIRDHIIGVDLEVGRAIMREHAPDRRAQRRSGEGAGIVDETRLNGGNGAIAPGPDLDRGHRGAAWPRGPQHFGPAEGHAHGKAGAARQGHAERRHPYRFLATEGAADLRWHDADFAERYAEDNGQILALGKGGLRVGPDDHAAIFTHPGGLRVWLKIPLMHGLRAERALDHDLGLRHALHHIAASHDEMFCDIAGRTGCAGGRLRVEIVVEHDGIRLHGRNRVRHMGQHVILDLHQVHGCLSNLAGDSRHSRHDMPMEQHLVAGENLAADVVFSRRGNAARAGRPEALAWAGRAP